MDIRFVAVIEIMCCVVIVFRKFTFIFHFAPLSGNKKPQKAEKPLQIVACGASNAAIYLNNTLSYINFAYVALNASQLDNNHNTYFIHL